MNALTHPTEHNDDAGRGARLDPVDTLERHAEDRAVRTSKRIAAAAVVTTLMAALAGVALLVAEPAAGSNAEAALGVIAASSGMATAALAIGGFVHASVRGIWHRFPIGGRAVLWILIAIAVANSLVSQLRHLF